MPPAFTRDRQRLLKAVAPMPQGIAIRGRVQGSRALAELAWVEVGIVDDQNRNVPTAGNLVRFSIQGPAKILGVGNGDPTSGESVKGTQRSAFNGLCMVLVQTTRTPGDITLTAESDGLQATSVSLKSEK